MFIPQVWIEFGQFWQPPDLLGVVVITIKPWGDSQGMGSIPRQFMFVIDYFLLSGISMEHCQVLLYFFLFLSTFKLLQAQFFPVPVCQFLKEQSLRKEPILGPCLIKD